MDQNVGELITKMMNSIPFGFLESIGFVDFRNSVSTKVTLFHDSRIFSPTSGCFDPKPVPRQPGPCSLLPHNRFPNQFHLGAEIELFEKKF